jgi:hypothetical protein
VLAAPLLGAVTPIVSGRIDAATIPAITDLVASLLRLVRRINVTP